MKLDYDGFMLYASMHNEDVLKDILKFTSESWNDRITLSQDDISLIVKISLASTKALLRQYHE
jgi:hypothetical protein